MGKVLVTGAGGYVGGRLVRSLEADGHEVHALAREPVPWLEVGQLICDLCTVDPAALAGACGGADAVVHLAGEDEVMSADNPAAALGSTVVASERVAEACRAGDVQRLVYLSTVHVYGARMAPGAVLAEDMRPEPRSAYAISRLASEHVAASLAGDTYELVTLRVTNSVGAQVDPRIDRWSLVVNDLARQGARHGVLRLRSPGVQWRDFVALQDVCAAIGAACRTDGSGPPAGTYNIGSGTPATVLELAGAVQDAFELQTGHRPELQAPAAPPEAERPAPYRVAVDRIASCGVRPLTPLADAVGETVAFCLKHREEL